MKRHVIVLLLCLTLAVGLAAGFLIRGIAPADGWKPATLHAVSGDSSAQPSSGTNTSFLITATEVLEKLVNQDYASFASYADPERGVTFTPFSTVDPSTDVTLTAKELAEAGSDTTSYVWGMTPGEGEPLKLTIAEFLSSFLWDADYTAAPQIGVDTVLYTGNAQENVADCYPGCRFVDFYLPGRGSDNMEWSSLKLVFSWSNGTWYLVGVVHSQWTP